MKSFSIALTIACLLSIANLQAATDNQKLPEEPTRLYSPADITDVFNEQFDSDGLEDEEELETLEEIQSREQAKRAPAPK